MNYLLVLVILFYSCQSTRETRPPIIIKSEQLKKNIIAAPTLIGPLLNSIKTTIKIANPILACTEIDNANDAGVLVQRGNCTAVTKVRNAQKAGVDVLIIGNNVDGDLFLFNSPDGDNCSDIKISSLFITKSDFQILIDQSPIELNIFSYQKSYTDPALLFIILIAISVVIAGAFYSSRKERQQYKSIDNVIYENQEEEYVTLGHWFAFGFIIVASVGLILMFYFIDKLIYLLIGVFFIATVGSLTDLMINGFGLILPNKLYSVLSKNHTVRIYYECPFNLIGIICFLISLSLGFTWVFLRKDENIWILQDILSIALLISLQQSLRLPNIKIAVILLCLAFIYDIFWVFISPYFFAGESVMVKVATGGDSGENVPLLISIPRFSDELNSSTVLGFGDMALPGLLISFLLQYDYKKHLNWKRSYFLIGIICYSFGIIFSYLALILMHSAQPALLYIVPCVLIPILLISFYRNDFSELWNMPNENVNNESLLSNMKNESSEMKNEAKNEIKDSE